MGDVERQEMFSQVLENFKKNMLDNLEPGSNPGTRN